jgi:hypothetical protein
VTVPTEVEERVRTQLRDVRPRTSALPPDTTGVEIQVSPEHIPVPRAAWFVLTSILGLTDLGRQEKVAWEIDFDFLAVPMTLSDRKFGVRLFVGAGERARIDPSALGRRFLAALGAAVDILDKSVLLPTAISQLEAGNFVGNRYHQLRGHYEYFREAVDECLAGRGRWMADDQPARLAARQQEAFINYAAAIHSYFSWLEHVLVLALPFADFNATNDDLRQIIGSGWRDKYKRLFDVAHDPDANRFLGRLVELSKRSRNTWSHGVFDKAGGLLYVHIPGLGAVPMGINELSRNVHFVPIMGITTDFAGTWTFLDDVDAFLRRSPRSAFGMRYAESGLQVRFDAAARSDYRAAIASDAQFDELLERQGYLEDQPANMDW